VLWVVICKDKQVDRLIAGFGESYLFVPLNTGLHDSDDLILECRNQVYNADNIMTGMGHVRRFLPNLFGWLSKAERR
jgi:hypothetical protein